MRCYTMDLAVCAQFIDVVCFSRDDVCKHVDDH